MVREQRRTYVAALVLVMLGAGALVARHLSGQARKVTPDETLWRLTYALDAPLEAGKAKVRVALPQGTNTCRVLGESLSWSGWVVDVLRDKQAGSRYAVAVPVGDSSKRRFSATFDLIVSQDARRSHDTKEALSVLARAHYLRPTKTVQVGAEAVKRTLAGLSEGAQGRGVLLQRIFEYCRLAIVSDQDSGPSDAQAVLAQSRASPIGRVRAMIALCRAANIPARTVTGFVVQARRPAAPVFWVEAYMPKRWVPYDPESGYAGDLPPNYLPVRRGGERVMWAGEGAPLAPAYTIEPARPPSGASRTRGGTAWDILDLRSLPVGMRHTLAVLLLLPVGALITAVWRNIIGMQTFGTFTPALLAMSFFYADWRTGGAVLAIVLVLGLAGRVLLDRLKLLMVPRLSIILTLAVLCVAAAISAFDYYRFTPSANAVILPLVVLTMLVERFYIRSEEDGLRSAIKLLGGTLVVGLCCLALLMWGDLGRLLLRFPETLLWVAAALLLVGRYSGYRLTELVRFRDLAADDREET